MIENVATKQWLELIYESAWLKYPLTMLKCYPRRILPPQGYFNPKWYSVSLFCCAKFWEEPEFDMLPHTTGALTAQTQMKMGVPTYFVRKDYAEAVAQTNPPEDFRMSEIQWPLDAFLFVLPDAFVDQYFGWYVPFIAVCRCPKGTYPDDMPVKNDLFYVSRIGNEVDRILIHFPLCLRNQPPVDYTGAYPLTSPISIIQSAPWTDASYYEEQMSPFGKLNLPETGPNPEAEQILQRKVNAFAVKLMLALTAEPGYLESGTIQRPAKRDRKGEVVRDELWNPNLLGWKYKPMRQPTPGTGTHASPRLHWRRGHMTYQVKGQRDALVPVRDLPRHPVTEDVAKELRGKIDWAKVSTEMSAAFWQTHALRWVKPVLVNAAVDNDDNQTNL